MTRTDASRMAAPTVAPRPTTFAVTGARGFVGRRLIERLVADGHTVRALRRAAGGDEQQEGVRWFAADLARDDQEALGSFVEGAEVLVHCAGEVRDEPRMAGVHVDGTRRLIEAAAGSVRRWVQLSSCGVYGRPRSGDVDEGGELSPEGVYETTKLIAERTVLEGARAHGFAATVLRPSVIIAQDMPNDSLRSWIRRVARGQFFFIGPPGARVNYVHVDDVVEALTVCAFAGGAGARTYNLSLGGTVEEVVGVMCGELGRGMVRARVPEAVARALAAVGAVAPAFPLTRSRVEALTSRAHFRAERITHELGFAYSVPLQESVRRVVRSMRLARQAA